MYLCIYKIHNCIYQINHFKPPCKRKETNHQDPSSSYPKHSPEPLGIPSGEHPFFHRRGTLPFFTSQLPNLKFIPGHPRNAKQLASCQINSEGLKLTHFFFQRKKLDWFEFSIKNIQKKQLLKGGSTK